jgi:putative transposase
LKQIPVLGILSFMSGRNSTKTYIENSYYHIYNRGVEKRLIFQDEQDYGVYLGYLKGYLSSKNEKDLRNILLLPGLSRKERTDVYKLIQIKNFFDEITLLAYCLMPNHFHLFIKQKNSDSIDKFMNSLSTRYAMYFNRKYQRIGPLFQDVYKAVLVTSDEQFVYLSRYIHKQAFQGVPLKQVQPSSYPEYIGARNTAWVHPDEVLSHFSKTNPILSYESFVAASDPLDMVGNLTLETD